MRLLLIISFLLLLFDYWRLLSRWKAPLTIPIIKVQHTVLAGARALSEWKDVIGSYGTIRELLERDKAHVQSLAELRHTVQILEEENAALHSQLGVRLPKATVFTSAYAVGVSDGMDIDRGKVHGLQGGESVVTGATLIGRVDRVSEYRSTVRLLWDGKLDVPVRTSRGTRGIIQGGGGKDVLLGQVLQKDALFLDDQVYTSGEGGFASNLLIGTVSYIMGGDADVYKKAQIAPPVDYRDVRIVFLLPQ